MSRFLTAALLLLGCKVATQTDIVFDAGEMSRRRAAALRVQLRDRSGELAFYGEQPLIGPEAVPWPNVLPIVPVNSESRFSLVAELLDDERAVFSTQRRRSTFVPGQHQVLNVLFQDSCSEIPCTVDTTCDQGFCVSSATQIEPETAQAGVCFAELCFEHPRLGLVDTSEVCVGTEGDDVTLQIIGGVSGLVLTRAGDRWLQEESGTDERFTDIQCWGRTAMAVAGVGLVLSRSNAGVWTQQEVPLQRMAALSGDAPQNVWLADTRCRLLRRTPTGWEPILGGPDVVGACSLWSPRRDEVWVGSQASSTLAHYVDGVWESIPAPSDEVVQIVGAEGEMLVSATRTLYQRTDTGWAEQVGVDPWSVALDERGRAAVLNRGSTVSLRTASGEWSTVSSSFNQLWGGDVALGGNEVLFTRNGEILRVDREGTLRTESTTLTGSDLYGVAHSALSDDSVLAVGEGIVLRRSGRQEWSRETMPEGGLHGATLTSVVAAPDTWIVAGVDSEGEGILLDWPYSREAEVTITRAATPALRALAHRAGVSVAVGDEGVVLERVDGSWRPYPDALPTSDDLTSVEWEADGVLVVGTNGGELWRHDTRWQLAASLGGPIRCLRHDGASLIACADRIERLTADGAITISSPTDGPFRDLGIRDGSTRYAIGFGGELYRASPTGYDLVVPREIVSELRVVSVRAGELLAVGARGVIIRVSL